MRTVRSSDLKNLSTVQEKVFQAIPIKEGWTEHQIHQEIFRAGSNMNRSQVRRCLHWLVDHKYASSINNIYRRKPMAVKPINATKSASEDEHTIEGLVALVDAAMNNMMSVEEYAKGLQTKVERLEVENQEAKKLRELMKSFTGG